jgi:hypothetical protein
MLIGNAYNGSVARQIDSEVEMFVKIVSRPTETHRPVEDTYNCDRACLIGSGTEEEERPGEEPEVEMVDYIDSTLVLEKYGPSGRVAWSRTLYFDGTHDTDIIFMNDEGKTTDRKVGFGKDNWKKYYARVDKAQMQ